MNDIIWIRQAAGLSISYSQIQTKFKDEVAKLEAAKKWVEVERLKFQRNGSTLKKSPSCGGQVAAGL